MQLSGLSSPEPLWLRLTYERSNPAPGGLAPRGDRPEAARPARGDDHHRPGRGPVTSGAVAGAWSDWASTMVNVQTFAAAGCASGGVAGLVRGVAARPDGCR